MIIEKFYVIQPNGRKRIKVKYICRNCSDTVETHLDNYNKFKSKERCICRKCSAPKNLEKSRGNKKGKKYPHLQGNKSHNWKGGRRIDGAGYVLVHTNCTNRINKSGWSSYEKEHKLVVEQYFKRKLKDNEVVHHIDGNRQNNKIENLAVLPSHLHHKIGHQSLQEIGYQLVKSGFIIFDQEIQKYVAHEKLRKLLGHP